MDCRVNKALLGAAVKAPPFEAVGRTIHVAKRGGNSVSELNFATCTGLLLCEVLEDRWFEYVAADHGFRRRCNFRIGLFNNARNVESAFVVRRRSGNDAVALGVLARHLLHGEYIATACAFASFHKLFGDGDIRIHKVVGKDHGKRFVPDNRTGTQNGVPETERPRLANVEAGNPGWDDVSKRFEKLRFALLLKLALEFEAIVEMVFDGALGAARDEDHFGDAGRRCFLNRVLDQRLVDDGKHFFGHGLGGWQKTGTQTVDGKYDFHLIPTFKIF